MDIPETKKKLGEFYELNPELTKYIQKRRLKVFMKMGAVLPILAVFYISGLALDPLRASFFYIPLAVVLPFIIFEPQKYYKRPFYGKIISCKYCHGYTMPKGTLVNARSIKETQRIRYYVECEDGKKRRFSHLIDASNVYKIGDYVLRVPGLDYPLCYTERKAKICLKCGNIYRTKSEICEAMFCDMPLPVFKKEEMSGYFSN